MIRRILYSMLIGIGIGIFLYPNISTWFFNRQAQETISEFVSENVESNNTTDSSEQEGSAGSQSMEQKQRIIEYNEDLFENGEYLTNATMEETPDVVDFNDGLFGYIEIPAMNDLSLPLYIGSSNEHMGNGAAVLGGTSIPVGGRNTNAVIAGHRGWRSVPYFKYIELLKIGDTVTITNPWEKLNYRVEEIKIIQPDDNEAVGIQEGKDMITLITCHPYRSNGKYRYAVYCVRDEMYQESYEMSSGKMPITASDETKYVSSESDIKTEDRLRRISGLAIIGMVITTICINKRRKEKKGGNA